jgi:hypothetical protein
MTLNNGRHSIASTVLGGSGSLPAFLRGLGCVPEAPIKHCRQGTASTTLPVGGFVEGTLDAWLIRLAFEK